MRWSAYLIALWFVLSMHYGLRDAFQLGTLDVAPIFPLVLIVYISLWAPTATALAASLLAGVAMDLLELYPSPQTDPIVILGPWALGCLLGSYTTITMRSLVYRRNALSTAALTAVVGGLCALLITVVLIVRAQYDDAVAVDRPGQELIHRIGSALYSAASAFVIAPVLEFLRPVFAFEGTTRSGFRAGG